MKRFLSSGPTVSKTCFMLSDPRVTMDRTWVIPRVKRPVPWVRGSRPTSQEIGLISAVVRPSGRIPCSKMRRRTSYFSTALKPSFIFCEVKSSPSCSSTSPSIRFSASSMAILSGLPSSKEANRPSTIDWIRVSNCWASSVSTLASTLVFPARLTNSFIMPMVSWLTSLALRMHSRIVSSDTSSEPDSIIMMASGVLDRIRLSWLSLLS